MAGEHGVNVKESKLALPQPRWFKFIAAMGGPWSRLLAKIRFRSNCQRGACGGHGWPIRYAYAPGVRRPRMPKRSRLGHLQALTVLRKCKKREEKKKQKTERQKKERRYHPRQWACAWGCWLPLY